MSNENAKAVCPVCFRHCALREGERGFCLARICRNGRVVSDSYGKITSLALDPIEKKPLARFFPGSMILSVGSYGCNLRCPFCQNHSISWSKEAECYAVDADILMPEELAELADSLKEKGNIGVAFTYNEPLIGYEFVRDTARLIRERGMKIVLVTNGTAELDILAELAPLTDAMNIDLKGFTDRTYRMLGGDRAMTMEFIKEAVKSCHVELTALIVPGLNDDDDEMRAMCDWIASLQYGNGEGTGRSIPLHISRFFPRFRMLDREATDLETIGRLVGIARERLRFVCPGNC